MLDTYLHLSAFEIKSFLELPIIILKLVNLLLHVINRILTLFDYDSTSLYIFDCGIKFV